MSLFPVNSAREAFGYFRPLILVNAEPHPRGIPEGAARAVRNFEGRTVRRPARARKVARAFSKFATR